ncbi:MAG: S8 family serine peptidase [Bacteroidales bacterium]|nr:S8 family serine peptidase [Bacteroidales bacterium]
MDKKVIKVAIMDSGIELNHQRFENLNFIESYYAGNIFKKSLDNIEDDHGTSVMDIIRKSIVKNGTIENCAFYDVRVFDKSDKIKEEDIIDGISYCIANKINVINISLGLLSDKPSKELYEKCLAAYNEGIILVAASDNFQSMCYPAFFPFVFGVASGIIENLTIYGVQVDNPIEFVGKGTFQRLAGLNNQFVFKGGTSYATGHITGIITSLLQKNPDSTIADIKELLFSKGSHDIKILSGDTRINNFRDSNIASHNKIIDDLGEFFENKTHNIKNCSIFPFSIKEFSNFKYFDAPFNIVDAIDFPRNIIEDRMTKIKGKVFEKKWKLNELNTDIDTLILGYPFNLGLELNVRFYRQLLELYIRKGVNLYVLDEDCLKDINEIKQSLSIKTDGKIYLPQVTQRQSDNLCNLYSLGNVEKPVLAVISSTSQAGKFTVQLKIKSVLNKTGYKVGWLSTEPQGELFGADFCFPYGFKGTVKVNYSEWNRLLHSIIKGIEYYKNPDIIISGHQSGLLKDSKLFVKDDILKNFSFLSGIQPDAFVLALNSDDTLEYIERIVNVITNFHQRPILFISLSSIKKNIIFSNNNLPPIINKSFTEEEEWLTIADRIYNKFKIPVVNIIEEKFDSTIVNGIEQFFSKN